MSSSRRGINDYFDDEGSASNSDFLPPGLLEENLFYSSDISALLAETDQEDKSGSAMTAVVSQPALQKHVPGPGPEFQKHLPGQGPEFQKHLPGQGPEFQKHLPGPRLEFQNQFTGPRPEFQKHLPGPRPEFQKHLPGPRPESPKFASEVEMADAENPPEKPVSESLKSAASAPEKTDKQISSKVWCGPCKNRTGNGFVGHWTKSCPFAAESGFMEACARCGDLDHCVSFCPRLTWNGKKPAKIKDLYFYLVTCRTGLPPAIAEVDPRVIDPERWEKEVEYPQTPALARHRRSGVLNGTLPGKFDLNLWNELDVDTGLSLGLQIHPAHAPGGQHRCCYHPPQTQENTGSASQAEQPSRKSKARKDTTDSVLHGTMGGRIAKIPRRGIQAQGGYRSQEDSDRGEGLGRGREVAARGSGNFGGLDQTQRPCLSPLLTQDEFDRMLDDFDQRQIRERHNIIKWFDEGQKQKRSVFVNEIIARRQGTFGEVRGATSGLDAGPRRGEGHGLEYSGHLSSQSGRSAPVNRQHPGRESLTPERLTRSLQSRNQTHRQDAYTLSAGAQSSAFRVRDISHQNRRNSRGAPNQQ
ncbi:hypothetical protein BGAL_0252g00080 [Botrytis galanthina]|uniref:Uncharacterized protein n=1 Tax=Botrytis galanthina TaxID=278940 RepID=A0A4V4HU80_9HELO|nr:hypothetical protein BGAL_0252g00080 [Botrytis galanthina]